MVGIRNKINWLNMLELQKDLRDSLGMDGSMEAH